MSPQRFLAGQDESALASFRQYFLVLNHLCQPSSLVLENVVSNNFVGDEICKVLPPPAAFGKILCYKVRCLRDIPKRSIFLWASRIVPIFIRLNLDYLWKEHLTAFGEGSQSLF